MTTKKYYNTEMESTVMVEEMTRKEAVEMVTDWIEAIEAVEYTTDNNIYVEYKDGSYYSNLDGDTDGNFKKSNIKAIIMNDGYEYYIYGAYEFDENMNPNVA